MNSAQKKNSVVFSWQGIAPNGKKISGELSATTLARAENNLIRHRIRILSIKKKQPRFLFRPRFSSCDQMIFFNQLATRLQAGLPLLQAIDMACQQHAAPSLQPLHSTLRDDIEAGNGLAAGLEKFPQYFDAITCHLVRAGEKTATLDFLLDRIARHLQHMSTLRRKITRACFYPLITLLFATVITLIMLTVMTPRFAAIFQEMHAPLPALTRSVIYLGAALHRFFLPGFGMLALGAWLIQHYRKHARIRHRLDWLWLHMPILSSVIKKIILARFARTLSTLLAAGLPMTEALGMSAPVAGNSYPEKAIYDLQQNVALGRQLHHAMKDNPIFSKMMQQMIQAGEESGTLIKMLEKTAEFHEADVDHTAGLISQLLEPLIMLILGVLIGALVIALYLPIFKLGNAL